MGSLDPVQLTPAASLNRVRIVDLPGIALPAEVRGRTAYEFLSAAALAERVRQQRRPLGLGDVRGLDTNMLLRRFDRCFADADPRVREAATEEARRFGRYLGYVILTLRRGDPINRQARPDWDDSYWGHWATITTIDLGGGIVGGRMGLQLVASTAQTLHDAGMDGCAVRLAPYPILLPLIGAARTVAPGCQTALTFDFGHSFVKRACAHYRGDALAALAVLPPIPVRAITASISGEPTIAQVGRLGEQVVAIMADTWRLVEDTGDYPDPVFCASLASYLCDGQPLPRQGGPYSTLHRLAPNLELWLAQRLGAHLGRAVAVQLVHDGTAAARARAGIAHAAVITLGTSLGIGFPPDAQGLRPLAATFAIPDGGGAGWPMDCECRSLRPIVAKRVRPLLRRTLTVAEDRAWSLGLAKMEVQMVTALPLLVLISGNPGAGKSTLARQLAAEGALWLPLVSCDALRNGIAMTWAERGAPPGGRPGKEAVDRFYETIVFLLAHKASLIAELSLRRGLDEARVAALMSRCRIRNVHCVVAPALAQQRFLDRQTTRGAVDATSPIATSMREGTFDWSVFAPLDLPLLRLLVDTSDGYAPTFDEIMAFCRG